MIDCKIVADSINPAGIRLTSWILRYPRFIHSEFMTHRAFSRNAASSRAIPFAKLLAEVDEAPALPEYWGAEKKGMQSGDELDGNDLKLAQKYWDWARQAAADNAAGCEDSSLHRSLCNRLLEPFTHITVLTTMTEAGLNNFFALRAHPMAMPEFQVLAFKMLHHYLSVQPTKLDWMEWHLPFGDQMPEGVTESDRIKIACARACWISYCRHDKEQFEIADAFHRHDESIRLGHWSPLEHCAQAVKSDLYPYSNFDHQPKVTFGNPEYNSGSFGVLEDPERSRFGVAVTGISHWLQYRKMFDNENRVSVDLQSINAGRPSWIKV